MVPEKVLFSACCSCGCLERNYSWRRGWWRGRYVYEFGHHSDTNGFDEHLARPSRIWLSQQLVNYFFTAITLNLLLVFNIFTKFSPSLFECAWYGEDQIFIELNIRINRLCQNIYIVDVVSCSAYVLLRTWASLMATLRASPPNPSRWFHWLCCRFIIPLVINEFFFYPHSRQSLLCFPSLLAIYFALDRLHMIVCNTCSAEPHHFKTLVNR